MTKEEYLKLAIKAGMFKKTAWLTSVLAELKMVSKEDDKLEPLEVIRETWGFSIWGEEEYEDYGTNLDTGERTDTPMKFYKESRIKLSNASPDRPLFAVKDRIVVDNTWFPNVEETFETTFGNIVFNAICIVPAFGKKIPFIKGTVSIGELEDKVAPILRDTPAEGKPRQDNFIYCDEWIKFLDSREHYKSISHLLNQSATVKTITKSPEFDAFKKKLTKEYEGQLEDPVKLVEYEKKLQDFDNAWLKGDPADKTFLQGKVRNVARKKMHISIGSEPGFETKSTVLPITESLDEGWPTEPDKYVSMINGIRHASLSRGKETVKGGVTAKYLLRAGNNFTVINTDCGAKNGLYVLYDNVNINRLVGRYIINGSDSSYVHISTKDEAIPYKDKYVRLRSPAYCRLDGDNICKICAGDGLALNPSGISIALTEMSSIVMTDFMKAMHDTTIKTVKLNVEEIFS